MDKLEELSNKLDQLETFIRQEVDSINKRKDHILYALDTIEQLLYSVAHECDNDLMQQLVYKFTDFKTYAQTTAFVRKIQKRERNATQVVDELKRLIAELKANNHESIEDDYR